MTSMNCIAFLFFQLLIDNFLLFYLLQILTWRISWLWIRYFLEERDFQRNPIGNEYVNIYRDKLYYLEGRTVLVFFHSLVACMQINTGEKYFVKSLGLLIRVRNSNEICKQKSKKSHCLVKYAARRFQLWWNPKFIYKEILERIMNRVAQALHPIPEFK